jgi:hypothetical protein
MILRRILLAGCTLLGAATTVTVAPGTQSAVATPSAGALVVGDSILAGIGLSSTAVAALQANTVVIDDSVVCRRLLAPSCSHQGVTPATALATTVAWRGQFAPTLVVGAGYNDTSVTPGIDAILAEARAQGLTSVLWLTYREAGANAALYRGFNDTLRARAALEPDLHVLDWAAMSAAHPEWVAADGLHLRAAGALQMANLIALGIATRSGAAPPPTLDRCAAANWSGVVPPSTPPDTTAAPAGGVHPLSTPHRMIDTRDLPGKLGRGRSLEVPIVGKGGVPPEATAVLATIVAVSGCVDVFVAAYPCGAGVPTTSVVNATAGSIIANGALVRLSGQGSLCLYANGPVDVVVDVAAWVGAAGAAPSPVPPSRLVDTRPGFGQRLTVPQHRIAAGTTLEVPVSGLPEAVGATAVAVNVAAVAPATDGFLTLFPGPCSNGRPLAASLNVAAGRTMSAGTTSAIGTGSICVFTSTTTDIVIDLGAVYGAGDTRLVATSPDRLLDTRETRAVAAGGTIELDLDDPALGAPPGAIGLVGSIATTEGKAPGFLTVYPCAVGRPNVSNLNMNAGQTIANLFVSGADWNRKICIFSLSSTQVIVDLEGWITT